MQVVLASNSPRRKELLKEVVQDFIIKIPNIQEDNNFKRPSAIVKDLAYKKASAINDNKNIIIAADTIVYFKGNIIGKPKDKKEAVNILMMLSGQEHYVYTGVCLLYKKSVRIFYEKSTVIFKNLSKEQIKKYVDDFLPLDKAGAYGIQDRQIVKSYKGSYSNIVGFPVEKTKDEYKKWRDLCQLN